MYRKVMYFLGSTLKYTMWASSVLFAYHFYLVKRSKDPESALHIPIFLSQALKLDYNIYNMHLMMTRPPVQKLLPSRPPAPQGQMYPKTLVLNLRGTLVHSDYKFGVGFEVQKRPGLSMFINRLSK